MVVMATRFFSPLLKAFIEQEGSMKEKKWEGDKLE